MLFSRLEGLPDESRGPPQRRQNRPHELHLQREAVEEDHEGLYREGRERRVRPIRGKSDDPLHSVGIKIMTVRLRDSPAIGHLRQRERFHPSWISLFRHVCKVNSRLLVAWTRSRSQRQLGGGNTQP